MTVLSLRCFKGAYADEYDTVSAEGLDPAATAVSVTIKNPDGTTFAGPWDSSTSGAVTSATFGTGDKVWTFDPAHADAVATASLRLSRQFNQRFRVEFTVSAGATDTTSLEVCVNGREIWPQDYPDATVYASVYGVASATWSTPEYGSASRTNPARVLREAHAMIATIGAEQLKVRGLLYDSRANNFTNLRIIGDPAGAIRPRAYNTISFVDCTFEDIDLQGGATNGWFTGSFQVVRGRLSNQFAHLNGAIEFVEKPTIQGYVRAISSTSWIGEVKASGATIEIGGSLGELNLYVTQGSLELRYVRSTTAINLASTGAVVKLWTANTFTGGTLNLAGFFKITDENDVVWDGVSQIGGVTVAPELLASRVNVLDSEAVITAAVAAVSSAVAAAPAAVWGYVLSGATLAALALNSAGRWVRALTTEVGVMTVLDAGAGDADGLDYSADGSPTQTTSRKLGYPMGTDLDTVTTGGANGGDVGEPTPDIVTQTDAVLDGTAPMMPKTLRTKVL